MLIAMTRFGSALNLNIHFHILFLDGVYVYRDNRPPRFKRVKAPALAAAQDYASLLKIMSAHWVATSGGSACSLARQAYRALESEHEVQFRFLFTCEEGAQPIRLSASWVERMPPSHFILLDAVKKNRSVQAIIEERPATIVVPGS